MSKLLKLSKKIKERYERLGVTEESLAILEHLRECDEAPTMTELANGLSMKSNTLTGLISKLVKKDLVNRVRNASAVGKAIKKDGRKVRVQLTSGAYNLFNTLEEIDEELPC